MPPPFIWGPNQEVKYSISGPSYSQKKSTKENAYRYLNLSYHLWKCTTSNRITQQLKHKSNPRKNRNDAQNLLSGRHQSWISYNEKTDTSTIVPYIRQTDFSKKANMAILTQHGPRPLRKRPSASIHSQPVHRSNKMMEEIWRIRKEDKENCSRDITNSAYQCQAEERPAPKGFNF